MNLVITKINKTLNVLSLIRCSETFGYVEIFEQYHESFFGIMIRIIKRSCYQSLMTTS